MKIPKLAQEVFNVFGNGVNASEPLEAVRQNVIARNWLNYWALSQEDFEFVQFHNEYMNQI
jgi:hypothetical protein